MIDDAVRQKKEKNDDDDDDVHVDVVIDQEMEHDEHVVVPKAKKSVKN
jgi:hypothetical protein